jgi:hypothetical protein
MSYANLAHTLFEARVFSMSQYKHFKPLFGKNFARSHSELSPQHLNTKQMAGLNKNRASKTAIKKNKGMRILGK